MELKELILSTLEELDERIAEDSAESLLNEQEAQIESEIFKEQRDPNKEQESEKPSEDLDDEVAFLEHAKERLLVLFEGLQTEEIKGLEAKLDITLNFLEYQLAIIEDRLEVKRG